MPEHFTARLGTLEINDNVRFSDLVGTESVAPVITGRDFVIATVAAPTKGIEAPAPEAGAAPAPAKGTKAPGKPAAKK